MVYYNEFDKYAAQWLRNLIAAGELTDGTVDERDIKSIGGSELAGVRHAHFFAGIGGWPLALRLAGWPEEREVWTGSCPCQPFSQAGRHGGFNDERHLWPVWLPLIAQLRPSTIFGEQVASEDGRTWLDRVRLDLEALGYAVGAADLCAASVGAPHIRQRLFWVGISKSDRRKPWRAESRRSISPASPVWTGERLSDSQTSKRGGAGKENYPRRRSEKITGSSYFDGLSDSKSREAQSTIKGRFHSKSRCTNQWNVPFLQWADGSARRIEPGLSPLAHGVPCRVGKLRAYGNAIVPQVAAEFIKAFLEAEKDMALMPGEPNEP